MLNEAILNNEVQEYIHDFNGDVSKIAFSGSPFQNITSQELIQQIEGKQNIKRKLLTWYSTPNILYPPKLNLEQTSSEKTAKYKASLISGKTLADITGGFGVDSFFFAENITQVHHFETNELLSKISKHNFIVLRKKNISCFVADGLKTALKKRYDIIYADPSRRHDSKGKVFYLKDYQPNIPENILGILKNCDQFLLKTSPMLDISIGLSELRAVAEIHVVAINNEVKELLWLMKSKTEGNPTIKTINFTKSGEETFNFEWNKTGESTFALPQKYLYEPNVAILKSGAFSLVSERLQLNKLHKNSHLYTSEVPKDFPGRRFKIDKIVPYKKKEIRTALSFKKANIATRNFPESVVVLRKKWKLQDGGNIYLFFTTNVEEEKIMLVCSKM